MADAVLTAASVKFHTTDTDDKDFDTHVAVTVRQRDGLIAARVDDDSGHFPNHSDKGPFDLQIDNASPKSALTGGSVEVHIDPVGDDRWTFNLLVDLVFNDGSHVPV